LGHGTLHPGTSPVPAEQPRPGRPVRVPARIAVLTPAAIGALPHGRAFLDRPREDGWIPGENLTVDYRFGKPSETVMAAVADVVRLKPDVIVAGGAHILKTLKAATDSVPIVMALGDDPVANGLIRSLARPGGNLTGTASLGTELIDKRFELLKQVSPQAARFACIGEPDVGDVSDQGTLRAIGAKLDLQVQFHPVRRNAEYAAAFDAAALSGADGLVLLGEFLGSGAGGSGRRAAEKRLPSIAPDLNLARAGYLLAYGPNYPDLMRRAAGYVDRILKGAKPADLPVDQPTTFDFAINLTTARAIGLTIPQSVLQQATEVIQ
jgi:putative ABC transport system substrate-binding protein